MISTNDKLIEDYEKFHYCIKYKIKKQKELFHLFIYFFYIHIYISLEHKQNNKYST